MVITPKIKYFHLFDMFIVIILSLEKYVFFIRKVMLTELYCDKQKANSKIHFLITLNTKIRTSEKP